MSVCPMNAVISETITVFMLCLFHGPYERCDLGNYKSVRINAEISETIRDRLLRFGVQIYLRSRKL